MSLPATVESMFERAMTEPNTGCWLYANRSSRQAWRVAYGPIPVGLWVLHRCDNRRCVNPAHLFLGTRSDNVRDCVRKGRMRLDRCASNKLKTSCRHGHPFSGYNLIERRDGSRDCRTCKNARIRRWYHNAKRALAAPRVEPA